MEFRDLHADEIECRVGLMKPNGLTLLLYKDARCDMRILDETVGAANWQREHYECKGNLFCRVGIDVNALDEIITPRWIWKADCGTESNAEAEKGEASDSFKRACVNWGIGRELYTAPFIWVDSANYDVKNGKCNDKFIVDSIVIKDKRITGLKIYNQSKKCVAFTYGKDTKQTPAEFVCSDCGASVDANMAARTQKAFNVVLCKDCGLKRSEQK